MFESSVGAIGRDAVTTAAPGQGRPGDAGDWDPWTAIFGEIDGANLSDAALVDELATLERTTSAAAAAKARLTAELHDRRRARDVANGRPAARCGAGVGHEVALARHESPYAGREHVTLARALVDDMPETLAALARGEICEASAQIMVRETADLSRENRRRVDSALGPSLLGKGDKEILGAARRMAYELDTAAAEERVRRARARRRVTLRGLGDGMARISGELPAERALAAMESLREFAATCRATGDDRSGDQVIADAFADRLNGSPLSNSRDVEVQVVMNAEMLLGGDTSTPADVPGYGPIPNGVARDLLSDPDARVFVRRLYAHPDLNTLVSMESARILFEGQLRRLLFTRDGGICRTPGCTAPIRHGDHVRRRREGGTTTLDNGEGLCEACNYAREAPGWEHRVVTEWPDGHEVEVTTPTGHTYRSHAPPLPVTPSPDRGSRTIVIELYRSDLELVG